MKTFKNHIFERLKIDKNINVSLSGKDILNLFKKKSSNNWKFKKFNVFGFEDNVCMEDSDSNGDYLYYVFYNMIKRLAFLTIHINNKNEMSIVVTLEYRDRNDTCECLDFLDTNVVRFQRFQKRFFTIKRDYIEEFVDKIVDMIDNRMVYKQGYNLFSILANTHEITKNIIVEK